MLTGQELFGPEGTARLTGRVCDRVRPEGPATMTRGGLGVLIPGFGTQLLYAIVKPLAHWALTDAVILEAGK